MIEKVSDLESQISVEQVKSKSVSETLELLGTGRDGLSTSSAEHRFQVLGPNAIEEKKENEILKFLKYFNGPIAWIIEIAAVLSLIIDHIIDFVMIVSLLVINGFIGFWDEHKASDALAALKEQLALKARVRRDGKWMEIDAERIVPGDIIKVRLGDIIPADLKLVDGSTLSVDQSALTGESLPVYKEPGDIAYSGTIVKKGEMEAVVVSTGSYTYFGRTAKLVQQARTKSNLEAAVLKVGNFLIFSAFALAIILVVFEFMRGLNILNLLEFVLVLIIASVPVAMPAVLSVTMALGAYALSRKKAIVSHLESIEELSGVDVLCSDKTGTLTKNEITVEGVESFGASREEILLAAALASREEDADPIDSAILRTLEDKNALKKYETVNFTPFDPVRKRTESVVRDQKGNTLHFSKGAPQVIATMCEMDPESRKRADAMIRDYASKGFRTLGVASSRDGKHWDLLGLLALGDPPREDSKATIEKAEALGLKVKMLTGDNALIAREISRELGLGENVVPVGDALHQTGSETTSIDVIEKADGFAEVFPEHKFEIVSALQKKGHIVAMTGDGVNDAPALKQANAGIAVSGATDAARAAADLILIRPGLSVIVNALEEARRIFNRMSSYTIYRIAMTFDIMIFVVLAMLKFNTYPLTPVMIIILSLLDDIPIMSIAYDNAIVDRYPEKWHMGLILKRSAILGLISVVQTFSLMLIGYYELHMDILVLQAMMFLQLVVGGHLMLFVTRSRKHYWSKPRPSKQLFTAIVATQIFAVLLVKFGVLVPPLSWTLIGMIWLYNLIWMFPLQAVNSTFSRREEKIGKTSLKGSGNVSGE